MGKAVFDRSIFLFAIPRPAVPFASWSGCCFPVGVAATSQSPGPSELWTFLWRRLYPVASLCRPYRGKPRLPCLLLGSLWIRRPALRRVPPREAAGKLFAIPYRRRYPCAPAYRRTPTCRASSFTVPCNTELMIPALVGQARPCQHLC